MMVPEGQLQPELQLPLQHVQQLPVPFHLGVTLPK